MKIENLVKQAYKKLKSYSYYENRNLALKYKILKFENDHEYDKEKMDEKFNIIAKEIREKNLSKYLSSLDVFSLPKTIDYSDEDDNVVNNTIDNMNYYVKNTIDYVDFEIEVHILGVMWVMLVGKNLEKDYDTYTCGNKLFENFTKDNLRIFKPYFYQYQNWKKEAIDIVDERMNNNKRSLVMTLDLKEYYYSVNIDFNKLKNDISINERKNENIDIINTLTDFIEEIIEEYSNKLLKYENKEKARNILPIGFLPSNILSNWYLKEFDKEIIRKINPLYYKRYVDDILIVLNGEFIQEKNLKFKDVFDKIFLENNVLETKFIFKNKEPIYYENNNVIDVFYKIFETGNETKAYMLNELVKFSNQEEINDIKDFLKENKYKLITEKWDNKNKLVKDFLIKIGSNEKIQKFIKFLEVDNDEIKKFFSVKIFHNNANIFIQESKVKIFDFKHNGSKAIIETFKKELLENNSTFKFLPEKFEELDSFDEEVYKLKSSDNIHKLSSIDSIELDKYNLSKFLAKIIYSEKLENSEYTKEIDKKIEEVFKGAKSIEYYYMWEKIFTYYLINNKYDCMKKFFKNVYDAIEDLKIDTEKFQINNFRLNTNKRLMNIKKSLINFLAMTFSINYSLNDDVFLNDLIKNKKCLYEKKDAQANKCIIRKLIPDKKISEEASSYINEIYTLKERFRQSNMLKHSMVREPLMNFCYENIKKFFCLDEFENVNFISDDINNINNKSAIRCHKMNPYYYKFEKIGEECKCKKTTDLIKDKDCNFFGEFSMEYVPRFIHLHECILYKINYYMAEGKIVCRSEECNAIEEGKKLFCKINNLNNYIIMDFIDKNLNDFSKNKELRNHHFAKFNYNDYLFKTENNINYLEVNNKIKKDKLKIGIVHIEVFEEDLKSSFNKLPNLNSERLNKINRLLNESVRNGAEMIIFPEVSIPFEWLSVIANFSRVHDVVIIAGLEHIIYENGLCCNYIATIIPDKNDRYNYSLIKLRLKNYYSPNEKNWVIGHGWKLPEASDKFKINYDLFRWKGIDFSNFSCFELANIRDRSLFTSYVDLLIGCVHNRDTNYYSNIIESLARDVHCYFVHVNNSRLGDNRIISPSATNKKNILQITGGLNDTVLIGEIDVKSLREFQQLEYNLQIKSEAYKPVPPQFNNNNVKIRNNRPL